MRSAGSVNFVDKIPQECVDHILSYLANPDLVSVSVVSRRFHIIVQRLLYRDIKIDWTRPPLRRVLILFRVIYERPDLADRILHMCMIPEKLQYPELINDSTDGVGEWAEWRPPPVDGDPEDFPSLFEDAFNVAKKIVTRARFPFVGNWIKALGRGDPYAFATVLLSQLHNLQTLRLDYTFVWQSGFPGLMMRHALRTAPPGTLSRFSKLSVVEYGLNVPISRDMNGGSNLGLRPIFSDRDPRQFAGWFYLPSLKSLEIWLTHFEGVKPSQLPHLANVERLVLTECSIDEDEVRDLLSCLMSVKVLHVGLVYPSGGTFGHPSRFSWSHKNQMNDALFEGLMSVKDTVEHLSIGLELCPATFGQNRGIDKFSNIEQGLIPFRGFLKHFPLLQTAELPAVMLFGWNHDDSPDMAQLLPSTLRKLCIRENKGLQLQGGHDWKFELIMQAIRSFRPDAQSTTPLLEMIAIREFEVHRRGRSNSTDVQSLCEGIRSSGQRLNLEIEVFLIGTCLSPGVFTSSRELEEYEVQLRPIS